MARIRSDEFGLYVAAGGWKARPHPEWPSKMKAGDSVDTKHFGGSPIAGIGKLPGRGKYREYWYTCGMFSEKTFKAYPTLGIHTEADSVQWHADHARSQLWQYYWHDEREAKKQEQKNG